MDIYEELRLAEERAALLRERNEQLAQRLAAPPSVRGVLLLGAAIATLSGIAAFVQGRACYRAASEPLGASAQDLKLHAERLADEQAVVDACMSSVRKANMDLTQCEDARMRSDPAWHPTRSGSPCLCQADDPLCSCL